MYYLKPADSPLARRTEMVIYRYKGWKVDFTIDGTLTNGGTYSKPFLRGKFCKSRQRVTRPKFGEELSLSSFVFDLTRFSSTVRYRCVEKKTRISEANRLVSCMLSLSTNSDPSNVDLWFLPQTLTPCKTMTLNADILCWLQNDLEEKLWKERK